MSLFINCETRLLPGQQNGPASHCEYLFDLPRGHRAVYGSILHVASQFQVPARIKHIGNAIQIGADDLSTRPPARYRLMSHATADSPTETLLLSQGQPYRVP
ncbi:hypothetical protein PVAR5_4320 [Paecilomyces variotii No. 5]|uniref:Uncharacterized protein n=1 Tax=Byssochlamys spectabilis (strain No. 5 / NBRC 109023) TaxID=1356009 RepID=V5FE68_BYSSN|nr:hypothetical protein PVAR5_4320 [Paecilomyces variotii No. 5]